MSEQNGNNECQGCCTGNEILCISTPCPIQIVLLGIDLELNIECLSLGSTTELSPAQLQGILNFLSGLLGSLGTNLPTQA